MAKSAKFAHVLSLFSDGVQVKITRAQSFSFLEMVMTRIYFSGARMRFKKTEVCQTCSKLKNVCQTCLLDLEYGLPTQVRDSALKINDEIPQSEVNKEFYLQNVEKQMALNGGELPTGAGGGKSTPASDVLSKLARTTPYYKRNLPHICSFWVKGECKRGEECPYRHEKPSEPDDPLSEQNIRDRYYGTNDPVAEKLLKRAASLPVLETPSDKTITTLYVGSKFLTKWEQTSVFYELSLIFRRWRSSHRSRHQRSVLSLRRNQKRNTCSEAAMCLRAIH